MLPDTNSGAVRAGEDQTLRRCDGVDVTVVAVEGGDAVVKKGRGRSGVRGKRPWRFMTGGWHHGEVGGIRGRRPWWAELNILLNVFLVHEAVERSSSIEIHGSMRETEG